MNAKDSKLKDRIAKKRAEIKELQGKRAELRGAGAAASTSRAAKPKRSTRRGRSQQASATA
jgi:hypothetical protein